MKTHRRWVAFAALWIGATIAWVFFPQTTFQPDDWRGDLAARIVFGAVMIGIFLAAAIYQVRRRRDEDRGR